MLRDGDFHRLSLESDIEVGLKNLEPDINETGEIAWTRWLSGGIPSGIVLMRRIRNGDVDFDGDVDRNDFVTMPGCYTGSTITDGLCECRFFDIDHDRDIDTDDLDFLLRNYTGPLEDCNDNGTLDLEELLIGTATDCDLNARPDTCDLSDNPDLDIDGDGFLDACCSPGAPVAEMIVDQVVVKNRYLSFDIEPFSAAAGVMPIQDDGVLAPWSPMRFWTAPISAVQAIRVTFVDLPEPFDVLNGQTMWVGEPREVSENGASEDPLPGFPNFWAATLECSPYYTDWSTLGTVHVYHEGIVPAGTYHIQGINEGCGSANAANFSPSLSLATARWGDTIRDCTTIPCPPPDGVVNITDISAILGRFVSAGDAISKTRADMEPATLDHVINISDALFALGGFQGLEYPFTTVPPPCGE